MVVIFANYLAHDSMILYSANAYILNKHFLCISKGQDLAMC